MILTISGKLGSGKSTAAKLAAKKLNLKHYSTGDFMREIAAERGISLLELSKLAEKDKTIDEKLDQRQIELGKSEDNFIIDARLGWHFIPNSIKVFLDVDLDTGAQRIFNDLRETEKENKTLEDTKKGIVRRMESETLRYKTYYGINCYDLNNYDLVVDTTNLNIEEVVDKIVEFVKTRPGLHIS